MTSIVNENEQLTGRTRRCSTTSVAAGILGTGIALFSGYCGVEDVAATEAHTASGIPFVGAGDIASKKSNTAPQFKTAEIISKFITANPNTVVFTTGDNAYPHGTAGNFSKSMPPAGGGFVPARIPLLATMIGIPGMRKAIWTISVPAVPIVGFLMELSGITIVMKLATGMRSLWTPNSV